MSIADLSTLISSIALVGVALSLYLQGGQLRSSQTQATTAAHIELMKFGLQYPAVAGDLVGVKNPDEFVRGVALNWHVSFLQESYSNKTITDKHLRSIAGLIFSTDFARNWWTMVGNSYSDAATSRREKRFFTIVNEEFQRAKLASEITGAEIDLPDKPADSSAPSS
jgi:hypothetical protein